MAKSKKKRRSKIPTAKPLQRGFRIPNQPERTLRDDVDASQLNPRFSFLFFEKSSECISSWSNAETVQLFDKLQHMSQMTWEQVLGTGGRLGVKTGVAYTNIPTNRLKRSWPNNLSPDAQMAEFRVCQTKRVFGIRKESTFYLVWLDKNHAICPMK